MGASDFSNLPHIGESVRRKEDYRFLTGNGQYTDDITLANQSYAVFVRSPHAHATVKSVDISGAEKMPGVIGIFSGKDIEGKMGGLPCGWLINNPDGTPMKEPPHPILAIGKVRYVGDHVAMVVAETAEQARNAAEAVVSTTTRSSRWSACRMPPKKPAPRSMTRRPTTNATSGRWATRRRSMPPSRRPRMSLSSTW